MLRTAPTRAPPPQRSPGLGPCGRRGGVPCGCAHGDPEARPLGPAPSVSRRVRWKPREPEPRPGWGDNSRHPGVTRLVTSQNASVFAGLRGVRAESVENEVTNCVTHPRGGARVREVSQPVGAWHDRCNTHCRRRTTRRRNGNGNNMMRATFDPTPADVTAMIAAAHDETGDSSPRAVRTLRIIDAYGHGGFRSSREECAAVVRCADGVVRVAHVSVVRDSGDRMSPASAEFSISYTATHPALAL